MTSFRRCRTNDWNRGLMQWFRSREPILTISISLFVQLYFPFTLYNTQKSLFWIFFMKDLQIQNQSAITFCWKFDNFLEMTKFDKKNFQALAPSFKKLIPGGESSFSVLFQLAQSSRAGYFRHWLGFICIASRKLHIVWYLNSSFYCMANRFQIRCEFLLVFILFINAWRRPYPSKEQHLNIYVCFVQTLRATVWNRFISIVYLKLHSELKMTRVRKSI